MNGAEKETRPEETPGADGRPADAARRALRAARDRERAAGEDRDGEPPAEDAEVTVPEGTRRHSRPGDAARAALRRANADRRSGAETGAGATTPGALTPGGPGTEPPAGNEPPVGTGTGGGTEGDAATAAPSEPARTTRPGDAAREALRAARAEAARAEAEAEQERNTKPAEDRAPQRRPGASGAPGGQAAPGTREPTAEPGPPGGSTESSRVVRLSGARRRRDARTRAAGDRSRDVRDLIAGAFGLPPSVAPRGGTASAPPTTGGRREEASARSRPEVVDLFSKRPQATPDPSEEPRDTPPAAPPAARYPRSMAAPDRDGELRRTFASLPTRTPKQKSTEDSADRFAGTWWGNAWVAALEEGALDAARLARGRAYADRGHVDAITVTPGLVLAYVQGSRPRPYRVQVRLRTFSDEEWDRFLDAAAERPGHIAALLDRQVPHSLAECGVRLLPGPGDLEPRCNCPDDGHPCKHAAAVCYQTARLLDQDPFVLLLLRGRGERALIDALSRRNAARAARAAREQRPAPVPGVRAGEAVARRVLPPLPAPLPPPAHPEQPPAYPAAPGGPDPLALDQLATDAAARAHALLTTGQDPVADLTLWQDAVRLAAARPGSGLTAATRPLYSSLAAAAGRTPGDLGRAVAAWRQGGPGALAVLEEPWDPPAGRFDRARPQLLAADLPAFRPWRNRLTHPDGHAQLRLGTDGLWYAYESEPGQEDWWPRGTPDPDPVGALTGLGAPAER
ncbi:SWIM zinc finger family protein [Streptomyces sp. NPDC052036]|uniref:SWIM zinc finger family protein n=1 Tax=Streptomyces sp. NPDC052036 TaxID=3155171 RepID=UPI003418FDB9